MGYSTGLLDQENYIHVNCSVKYGALTKLNFQFSDNLISQFNLPEEEEIFMDEPIKDSEIIEIEKEITREAVAEFYGLDITTSAEVVFEYGLATSILWRQWSQQLPIKDYEFPEDLNLKTIEEFKVHLRSYQNNNKLFIRLKDGLLCYIYLFTHYIIKPEFKSPEPDLLANHTQIRQQLITDVSNVIQSRYLQIIEESRKQFIANLEPLIKNICYQEIRYFKNEISKLKQELTEFKNNQRP